MNAIHQVCGIRYSRVSPDANIIADGDSARLVLWGERSGWATARGCTYRGEGDGGESECHVERGEGGVEVERWKFERGLSNSS
jgi:hypothetical protein